jgi:hypothetical protein
LSLRLSLSLSLALWLSLSLSLAMWLWLRAWLLLLLLFLLVFPLIHRYHPSHRFLDKVAARSDLDHSNCSCTYVQHRPAFWFSLWMWPFLELLKE